jgi:hypothetical protein
MQRPRHGHDLPRQMCPSRAMASDGCAKAVAIRGQPQPRSSHPQNQWKKIIWPNMDSNFAPLGRSNTISTIKPPPHMWYAVLFKFTYNCPFVNNVQCHFIKIILIFYSILVSLKYVSTPIFNFFRENIDIILLTMIIF